MHASYDINGSCRNAERPMASDDPPLQSVSTAGIKSAEDYQDAVDALIAAAEINISPAIGETASKDRNSALLYSSILIVLASGNALLEGTENLSKVDIAGLHISIKLSTILFLLLALSTYYLISFLVASYRSLKRWELRRKA